METWSAGPATARPAARIEKPKKPRRQVGTLLSLAILGFVGGIALAVLAPLAFGDRSLTVMSGSMEPNLHVGDVVVEERISPLDARVGDIVTFRDPEDSSTLITHRVRSIEVQNGMVGFVTKGDANNSVEHWQIPQDGSLGRVDYRLWKLGYLLVWARSPMGRMALIVLPALALGIFEVFRIWRPKEKAAGLGEEG